MSHSSQHQRRLGFTLIELLVVIAIIAILAAILFPVFAQAREKARQSSCLSNAKQIGLALMGYIQDYDERFPAQFGRTTVSGAVRTQNWGADYDADSTAATVLVPSLINPYVKNSGIFRCASTAGSTKLSYMYNNLAAGKSQAAFTGVSNSILVAEGSPTTEVIMSKAAANPNSATTANEINLGVGHAITPNGKTTPDNHDGTVMAATGGPNTGTGATPLWEAVSYSHATRHSEGGNFLRGDGSAKWVKVTGVTTGTATNNAVAADRVHFPCRNVNIDNSEVSGANQITPDPGGNMTVAAAAANRCTKNGSYVLTFLIR